MRRRQEDMTSPLNPPALSALHPDSPLAQLGPYRLGRPIASGGMGVVYHATEVGTGREVAVKAARAVNREHLAALRMEVRALGKLRHPGLARLLASGVEAGMPWYAMALLRGPTLRDYLLEVWGRIDREEAIVSSPTLMLGEEPAPRDRAREDEGPRALASPANGRLLEVLTVARRLCMPLRYLHRRGMVHGDLKPRNVIIVEGGAPTLIDFGMASHFSSPEARLELQSRVAAGGTAPYLAPELFRGALPDGRSDIFSFGVMLYQAVCGTLPFPARSGRGLEPLDAFGQPPSPSTLVSGLDPRLEELISSMLATRPEARISDVADIEASLRELLGANRSTRSLRRRSSGFQTPHMVGRQTEVQQLLDRVERARERSGSCALVSGESGIGKTRLLIELVQRLRSLGVGFAIGRGDGVPMASGVGRGEPVPATASRPLAAFSEFFLEIADRFAEAGQSGQRERFPVAELSLVASFSPELTAALGRSDMTPAAFPSDAARQHLFAAMRTLLSAVCRDAPFVLLLDDLQWADPLSIALLADLSTQFIGSEALVVVCAARSEHLRQDIVALGRGPFGLHVEVPRFDPQLSQLFVDAALPGGQIVSPELLDFLEARAEGNPLILGECLRLGVASGWVVREGVEWKLLRSELQAGPEPPSRIERIFGESFRSLDEDQIQVAQAAAVVGRAFSEAEAASLVSFDAERLQNALRGLCDQLIIEEAGPAQYQFRHDRLREYADSRSDPDARRRLHGVLADALAARALTGDADVLPARLAQHYELSGNLGEAARYWLVAGERAVESWAFEEAVSNLERGLALAAERPFGSSFDRARWHRQLGDALLGIGDVERSRASLLEAARCIDLAMPDSGLQVACRLPLEWLKLELGRRRARRSPDELATEGVRVCSRLLQVYYHAGNDHLMLFATVRGLRLAARSEAIPERATTYSNGAAVAGLVPLRQLAARLWLEAERSTVEGDGVAESYVQMQLGMYEVGLGELSVARRHLERSIELARRVGFSRRVEESSVILATVPLLMGHYAAAFAIYDQVLHSGVSRKDAQTRCWALLGRTFTTLRLGLQSEGRDLDETLRLAEGLGRGDRLWAQGLSALSHLSAGRLDDAAAAATRVEREADRGPPLIPSWLEPYAIVAEVRLAHYERTPDRRAQHALRAACRRLEKFARVFPVAAARALRLRARMATALGAPQATQLLRESVARASSLGLDYDFAMAKLALARATGRQPESDVLEALNRCGIGADRTS
jgi:serine/threonine protein kinase/tetratricopeptide (TPR) repeat protein